MKKTRRHRTRNQRKRELIQTFCMACACALIWMMLCTVFVVAWAGHPAEQPVSYAEHMEKIQTIESLMNGGDSCGNLQD